MSNISKININGEIYNISLEQTIYTAEIPLNDYTIEANSYGGGGHNLILTKEPFLIEMGENPFDIELILFNPTITRTSTINEETGERVYTIYWYCYNNTDNAITLDGSFIIYYILSEVNSI